MNTKYLYIIYLLIVTVAYYILSYLTPISLCDDIAYKFIWPSDNETVTEPIKNISDVLVSQYTHYHVLNGRSIVHFFVQLFDGVLGKGLSNIVSSCLFFCFIYLVANFINSKNKLYTYSLITFMVFILIPGFHNEFLLFVGVFNYLWVTTATLLFITLLYKYKNHSLTFKSVAFSTLSFFAGWLHEGISVPITITLAIYCLCNYKHIIKKPIFYCTIFYALGTAFCVFSPGTMQRIGDTSTISFTDFITQKIFMGAVCMSFLRISYLIILLSLFIYFKHKTIWLKHIQKYKYFYLTWLFSFIPVFGSGATETRTVFYPECIAMIISVDLITKNFAFLAKKIMLISNMIIIVMFGIVLKYSIQNYQNYRYIVQQLKNPNSSIIAIPQIDELNNSYLNNYIREPIKFGPFENAQGFIKDNFHVKCLKVLYSKHTLCLLPEDIVNHIYKKDLNPKKIIYNKNKEMMIVKQNSNKNITHVSFSLNPEDINSLPFYKRRLAYQGSTYSVSKDYYDTLSFRGEHYLLICCPTNNIKRRIRKVVYC